MSGHKIVPLLEKNKDVFVHGGAVARHKTSFVSGTKKIPEDGTTELVVCAAATFKLWQPKPKVQQSAPKEGEPGDAAEPSPPVPAVMPRPMLIWRQPHAYIKAVIPLAGQTRAFAFGFCVLYFAPNKESDRKRDEELTEFGKQLRAASNFITVANSLDLVTPPLRTREYRTGGEYEQEDWVLAYRTVLLNYWHERLESSVIPSPEVFQYQAFAVDVSKHPAVDSIVPHTSAKAPLIQIAISTERVYWIPRHDASLIERDRPDKVLAFPVTSISNIDVNVKRGCRMEIHFGGGSTSVWKVACFSSHEGSQLLIELQRVWNLTRRDDRFPCNTIP